uniref:Uncharacterized protein n=1 Tax=Chromera velia CCMP2878 TaxID=1169474 RepID=A0A0G4I8B3_9ALVE|eukprot:Cvel_1978.t1-p1 / transcript=Cvel_1978.t1 / gene=Cvel_1978 / organism=Chromera_velia_CCMP2878 / gene_product=Protein LHY, putative / transcript_product=Protein LHY, putative / location=Cvel_scaffold75:49932-51479(+) / protein_length=516 / sequence_SO=supercontig / SO=protein_coding / is_pseudo=false
MKEDARLTLPARTSPSASASSGRKGAAASSSAAASKRGRPSAVVKKKRKQSPVSQSASLKVHRGSARGSRVLEENDARRWTPAEHKLFLDALQMYGKNWTAVQKMVGTRSSTQVRSHAQKYFRTMQKGVMMSVDRALGPEHVRRVKQLLPSMLAEYQTVRPQSSRRFDAGTPGGSLEGSFEGFDDEGEGDGDEEEDLGEEDVEHPDLEENDEGMWAPFMGNEDRPLSTFPSVASAASQWTSRNLTTQSGAHLVRKRETGEMAVQTDISVPVDQPFPKLTPQSKQSDASASLPSASKRSSSRSAVKMEPQDMQQGDPMSMSMIHSQPLPLQGNVNVPMSSQQGPLSTTSGAHSTAMPNPSPRPSMMFPYMPSHGGDPLMGGHPGASHMHPHPSPMMPMRHPQMSQMCSHPSQHAGMYGADPYNPYAQHMGPHGYPHPSQYQMHDSLSPEKYAHMPGGWSGPAAAAAAASEGWGRDDPYAFGSMDMQRRMQGQEGGAAEGGGKETDGQMANPYWSYQR